MQVKERHWKNILINPRFQLKLLSYFLALFLITTATLYTTTYLFFWRLKEKGLRVGIPEGHVYYDFLLHQKNDLDLMFLGLAGFNLILLITVGFIVSHRIAGPLHKLKTYLESEGSEDIRMRENDFFQELGPLISKFRSRK